MARMGKVIKDAGIRAESADRCNPLADYPINPQIDTGKYGPSRSAGSPSIERPI